MRRFIWRALVPVILICLAQGCRYGQLVENFPPAHQPNGAMVEVGTSGRLLEGELIEVGDTGLVILTDNQLQSLPYASIRSIHIDATNRAFDTGSQPLDPQRYEEVRLLSRYPQGMSPEVREQLLSAYGQTGPEAESR